MLPIMLSILSLYYKKIHSKVNGNTNKINLNSSICFNQSPSKIKNINPQDYMEYKNAEFNIDDKSVLAGYWFQWQPHVDLATIPTGYNIICIAFFSTNANGIPTFAPYTMTDEEFRADVEKLKSEGRTVLISLGGASEKVTLNMGDKEAFKNELIQIIDKYGFSGIDIDLEGYSVTAGDNQVVIPAVLREVKDYYKEKGVDFIITMAPEFIDLRGPDALYKPYIDGLEGYYNIIFPQYYNQGEDGIWSRELNRYLSQNSDQDKAEFLYTLTHAIVTGTQDFLKIPANKFAIGLPASPEAAFNGYVKNPNDVKIALDRLAAEGNKIRGLMTWSINQDSNNGYEFVNSYAPFLFS